MTPIARTKALDVFTLTKNIKVNLPLLLTLNKQVHDFYKLNILFEKFCYIIRDTRQRVTFKQLEEDLNKLLTAIEFIYDREIPEVYKEDRCKCK